MLNLKFDSNANQILTKYPDNLKLKENILQDIAEIVRKNIEYNIHSGISYKGTPLKPNKLGTQLFYHSGKLFSSVLKQKTISGYEVYISDERKEIAKYLQKGRKNMPSRPFFGIGNKMKDEIKEYLKDKKFTDLFTMR
jgi:phage gpG-like protein